MNKWGIGLLIVATLANAGILYLALDNRSKRKEIQGAVARNYLALQGLPPEGAKIDGDSVEMTISSANGVPINGITLENLKKAQDAQGGAQFGSTSGPVANQIDEVRRVEQVVNSAVAGMGAPKQKLDYLVGSFANPGGRRTFTPGILIYLAQSADERDSTRTLAANPNGANADAALKLFTAKVADVTAPGADPIRRIKIAHFLAALEPTSDDWQKRVAQIVGLRTYLKVLTEQDLAFQEIASRVTRRIEDDQATFVAQYQQLLHLSIQRSLLLSRELGIRNELDAQQAKDDELLKTKKTQKDKTAKLLDDLSKEVSDQSAVNATLEANVHATQRTVGRMLDEILKLEAELDAAEQRKGR